MNLVPGLLEMLNKSSLFFFNGFKRQFGLGRWGLKFLVSYKAASILYAQLKIL